MSHRCCSLALIASLCVLLCAGDVSASVTPGILQRRHEDDVHMTESSSPPHSHSHSHSHAPPLLELNETEILRWHAPDPLSYWGHDFQSEASNWRGLMVLHVLGMGLSFFVLLPVGIALRSVRHRWHGAAVVFFNVVALLSSAAGSLYKKLTGDLYTGSVHGRHGFLVLALAAFLATCDAFAFLRRVVTFLKSTDRKKIRLFWRFVVLNQEVHSTAEYTSLVHEEPDGYIESKLVVHHDDEPKETTGVRFEPPHGRASEWVNQYHERPSLTSHRNLVNHGPRSSITSNFSDDTLHNSISPVPTEAHEYHSSQERRPWLSGIGRAAFATAERSLVILAFVQILSGMTVYTGICRQNYINGCLAHLIKGGIFWCYGLLTFGRYLGAWADLGWAWNRLPARHAQYIPTAETVESFIIFLYGITNTWMERFGAAPGSPFTTKQIQHISIAVMFWFAGILGFALESKILRKWLSSSAQSATKPDEPISSPPSYAGSFNPFPSLVIGVTGAAMSAHHQTYLFQVQIHALWGFFLTGFAILRCLTYIFLWLRPPHSILPSRPPTEALASFFLASGGLVFILSTEQITFAAMRQGHDDVMFFFNFAVAVTCLALCWVLSVTAFKGWVTSRARASRPPTRGISLDAHTA